MNEIRMEVGKHYDERENITYVVQLIKFYDSKFDTGSVVKEFILDKGQTLITVVNVK